MRIIGENSATRLSIEYNAANYSENLIDSLAKSFNIFVEKFIAQSDFPLKKISLIDVDCSLTYRELDENANRIANSLRAHGVDARNKIALLLPRTSRKNSL